MTGAAPKPFVLIILGQTASGKSGLCLDIARRLEGEIVSMDALKVYRGMDAGTAKPAAAERASVPHHLLDLVEPAETFNVALYLERLEHVLADIHSRGRLPVIDCGTPMYLQAFLSGMLDGPEPDEELRARLEAMPLDELVTMLRREDPAAASTLHPNDRLRVSRALEYVLQTGEPIGSRQTHFKGRRGTYRCALTGPVWPEERLRERIATRIDAMLANGLIEEVRRIREGGGFSRSAAGAIGYREALDHIEGRCSLDDMRESMKRRTWQLARKQLMWFRRHADAKWLSVSSQEELKRAAIFLASELVAELRRSPPDAPLSLKREPRLKDLRGDGA